MELLREENVAGCPDCVQTQGGWRRQRREALSLGLVDLLAGGEGGRKIAAIIVLFLPG